jgi:pimeloyl-ACP methyl ester carboxylesterase
MSARAALRESWADVPGARLYCVEAGTGPLVLLLHGFPEFWYSWRYQLAALSSAGFRAVAPDLRGYNRSTRPRRVRDYRMSLLVGDAAALLEQAGGAVAGVVGHDWGGVIAWRLAMARPDLVPRLAILNAPHPVAFLRELRRPEQWLRSAYVLFFQLPLLPECVIRAGNFALVERALRREPVRPGAFSDADIRRYKEALSRPGALTAGLNYYRALLQAPGELRRDLRRIELPTLLLWGERDPYLSIRLTEGLDAWVPQVQVRRLPDASHWVQIDAAERVNEMLSAFLQS